MQKDNEINVMYTCKLRDGLYCTLRGMKPTGSIKGDSDTGLRLCIQPDARSKRAINCNKKSLVKVKEETLVV